MTITMVSYVRKPFVVDAVQVTHENMAELADWCGGEIKADATAKQYIQVTVKRPLYPRQSMAYVGDWILQTTAGNRVYNDTAFNRSFEKCVEKHTYTTVTTGEFTD